MLSLNAKGKYEIYKNELEKRKQREKEEAKSKIENLTEEEKIKIFQEFNEKDVVLVEEKNLLLPNEKAKKINTLIMLVGWFVLWFFVSFGLAILWMIGWLIIPIILGLMNIIVQIPKITFTCPFCKEEHNDIIRDEEVKESKDTGFIHAKCKNCKKSFYLLVAPDVLKCFEGR